MEGGRSCRTVMPSSAYPLRSPIFYDQGRFGRLFPTLRRSPPTPTGPGRARRAGGHGGPMDPGDDLSDPITLITDPAKSANNPNNPTITAGFTFLGQFLDHDMTFDPTSSLARRQDPESIRNFRIPALDLDNLYGSGPAASPHLYDQTVDGGRTTLLVERSRARQPCRSTAADRFDQPRNSQGVALIGDPRNDENLIVSQFHLALTRFHNRVVADVSAELGTTVTAQECSPRRSGWCGGTTSGWCSTSSCPSTVGDDVTDDVLQRRAAALSLAQRPVHPRRVLGGRLSASATPRSAPATAPTSARAPPTSTQQFFALIFDATLPTGPDPADLRGGHRAPRRFIDWQTFFDFGDGRVRRNKIIDTKLSTVLFDVAGPTGWRPGLAGDPQPAAQPHHASALGSADSPSHAAAGAPRGRPGRPGAIPPPQADATVVLHPARGPRDGRGRPPRSRRRSNRGRSHHRPDPRRPVQSYLSQQPDWTPTYGTGEPSRSATCSGPLASSPPCHDASPISRVGFASVSRFDHLGDIESARDARDAHAYPRDTGPPACPITLWVPESRS